MDDTTLKKNLAQLHQASYGWALACCNQHPGQAEEVLQCAYLKVLDGKARYGGKAAFKTWLFALIRNTAADVRRRELFHRLGLVKYRDHLVCGQAAAAWRPPTHINAQHAALNQALTTLPRRQREVLHLVFYQGLTLEDAAPVMGVSLGAARTHYHRGKQRLRRELERLDHAIGRL